ncbi:hypothetical protein ACQPU1_01365 [Clostridium paraputrificum]|uniref:hypothetical protein n=1 Tax=Clostridium paraputrificum TaxID=29363 RepID=UPI003D34A693
MQELIRNTLITATTIVTTLGIYVKATDNFTINTIRNKYKNVPAKQSIFNTVIKLFGYIIIISYLFLIVMIFIYVKQIGILESIKPKMKFEGPTISIILGIMLAVFFFISISSVFLNFNKIRSSFINKIKNESYDKVKNINIILNRAGMLTSGVVIVYWIVYVFLMLRTKINIVSKNGTYIFENNISDYEISNVIFASFVAFVCLTSFLEYDEYYLIFENGIERYIKKSEIKEIRKKELF